MDRWPARTSRVGGGGRQPEGSTPSMPGYDLWGKSVSQSVVLGAGARFLKQPRW